MSKHLLMMAGGTGGHIFPGLAIAHMMAARGWQVSWLGTPKGMEQTLVPTHLFPLHAIPFEGVVGRGLMAKLKMPLRLIKATGQAKRLLREIKPDVVIGMGGYPTVPGGMAAKRLGIPLLIHQSDAVAGLANKLLSRYASRVLVGFPNVFEGLGERRVVTGNPIRVEFKQYPNPSIRYGARANDRLRVVVMGGSRGASAINLALPSALALIKEEERPDVLHQAGKGLAGDTRTLYEKLGVDAHVVEFIDDTAKALAEHDLFVGRSGASTVSELAVLGVASVLVPYPHHKDQQQLHNAKNLEVLGAAHVLEQKAFTAERLAALLMELRRADCQAMAEKALGLAQPDATEQICDQIENVVLQTKGKEQ